MSILFMCYVSRLLDRFLHNARQPAPDAGCLSINRGPSNACQPEPQVAHDGKQAEVRCVNHGSAGYVSKIFQNQLFAETAEKTIDANDAFISRKFVSLT
jgi:hypothetical protein